MVLSMDRWVGKVAIVTGASSGIGAAIVENLVEVGLKVVGLARRKDRLEALAKKLTGKKGKLYPIQADISKEEDILNAFKWVKGNLGPVHILINNAGVIKSATITESPTIFWEEILRVNVIGLCIATREAIKDMKANNVDGHIIHINSVAGHQVPSHFPDLNIYPASKFAVTALTETLRLELNASKSKIKITSLSPGAVDTEMTNSEELSKETAALIKELVSKKEILDSKDIADGVRYALSTPPHVQIQELTIRGVIENF